MEVQGSTSSPAPSAPPPAPAPAAAPSAPVSTPSTPSQPTPYGKLNPSVTQSIFDQLDAADTGGTPAPDEATAEIPVAKVPGSEPTTEPTTAEPALETAPGEDVLPQKVRDALKSLPDRKLADALAESYHVVRDIKKSGLPVSTIRQFITDAPQYLAVAPSVDVLQHLAQTAQFANELGTGFVEGGVDGFKRMTGALIQSNPQSFVGLTDFLLRNTDYLAQGLTQNFGAGVAAEFTRATDGFTDSRNRNVIANMRARAAAAEKNGTPDDEVWGEVADKMEEFLKLGEKDRPRPSRPDPRDERIRQLEGEKQNEVATRREQFTDGVFNSAGTQLSQRIEKFLGPKIKGYPDEAREDIVKIVGEKLYKELLENKNIQARARAIYQSGRYDKNHSQNLTNFYVEVGGRLLGNIAAPVLNKYAKITAPRRTEETERLDRHTQRRDPGASGGPPSAPGLKPISSLSNPKDIFALLDAQAGDAG